MTKKTISIFSIIFYLFIAGLFFSGCGGGGDSAPVTATTLHIPEISNLQYSPQTATQNQGNGAVTATGTINFTDQGGDITKVTINKYDANNHLLSTDNTPVQNISGVVSGRIGIAGSINTATVANYRFEIYVTDLAGNSSNKLSGTFSVTAPVTTQSAVPDGALWPTEVIQFPSPPFGFTAVIGHAIAATLSPEQLGDTGLIAIDYMRILEEIPGADIKIINEKSFDNLVIRPLSIDEGGLFDRFPKWFESNNSTPIVHSEIRDGVLKLDLSQTPRNIVHWWTDKSDNKPNGKYYIEMRVKIEGKVGLQLGVDYWVDKKSDYNGWDQNCKNVNNCLAWKSDWFGDTNGQFIVIRAPHYQ